MQKVLIVKNITREGPGLLEQILKDNSISFDLVDLDKDERFPDPLDYSALFVLGGPDSANDHTPKMLQELAQIKKFIDAKIPYLGICLGMQVLVKATGGEVIKNEIMEIGFRDPDGNYFEIEFTAEGKSDPIFTELETPLKIFHLHGECVNIKPDVKLLATGKFCTNQVIKIGENAYGLQGHFELTPEMYKEWIADDPELLEVNIENLKKDYQDIQKEYDLTGKKLFTNFLKIAKLIN